MGGIITALRLIKTKKGDRMASFLLEDTDGSTEVLVFPETYKKAGSSLADDELVLVKGKPEAPEEGKSRILAAEVLPLEQAKMAEARFVTIRVPLSAWDRAKGERLRDILGAHRGDCPVTLELVRPGAFAAAVAPSGYYRVRPDADAARGSGGAPGQGSARARAFARRSCRVPRPEARRCLRPTSKLRSSSCKSASHELVAFPGDPAKEKEARTLEQELDQKRREIFAALTPWQKTLVARNPNRPYTLDYVQALFTEWTEVHGDRRYGDDPALVCGLALYKDRPVVVLGHQKGRDTKQKIYRNFGMPKPEGYRKALRVMQMAAQFLPAHPLLRGHPGGLSRRGCRRARPGRGHCLEPSRNGAVYALRSSSPSPAKGGVGEPWPSRWGIG